METQKIGGAFLKDDNVNNYLCPILIHTTHFSNLHIPTQSTIDNSDCGNRMAVVRFKGR